MTDREKLIALLVQGCREERGEDDIPCCEESFCKDNHTSCYGETADYLLAHGVVVRRWIPVTERLPEKDGSYLCFSQYLGSGWCSVRGFARDGRKKDEYDFQRRWKNVWYDYDSEYGYCVIDSITHWMPLPEPPKEGE